jgi:CTP synthase (UTP-ammonia lyase)
MPATVIALGDRDERYLTHRELDATLALIGDGVARRWIATDSAAARALDGVDGVWLVPGSPYRDDGAAYDAIVHCLRTGTPYSGDLRRVQYACVQLARTWAGQRDAAHAESDPEARDPVVVALACSLYGERRVVSPVPGTRFASICGERVPAAGRVT